MGWGDMTTTRIMDYSEKVILAALVLCAFMLIGSLLSHMVRRLGRNKSVQGNRVYRLIAGSIKTVVLCIGAVTALGTLGVNISALVAGLGLTGFAVGFALKDAISNLVAGLMILVYAPFDLGDTVDVGGIKGKVTDINLRYVTIQTEVDLALIPNGNFITSVIRKTPQPPGDGHEVG